MQRLFIPDPSTAYHDAQKGLISRNLSSSLRVSFHDRPILLTSHIDRAKVASVHLLLKWLYTLTLNSVNFLYSCSSGRPMFANYSLAGKMAFVKYDQQRKLSSMTIPRVNNY